MPMTRAQMEAVIAGGGSVLHGGRLYTRVETLPSEAELAQGDPAAEAAAAAKLQEQIAQLQEQVAKLQAQQPAPAGGEQASGDGAPPSGQAPTPKGGKKAEAKDGEA